MKNKAEDLRNHLFATIEALADKEHPMDINRALAISEVARTVIDLAKVEVAHQKIAGGQGSGFLPPTDEAGAPKPVPALPNARVNGRPGP